MIIVMQGRVRSGRLPGKGFFTFFGKTVWERIALAAMDVRGAEEVVFATGHLPENELIRPLVKSTGVRFLAGNEENVLERYCQAVRESRADYVVRVTCDNYLVQPQFIEELVAAVRRDGSDYGYIQPLSHYTGEVVRREVLLEEFDRGNYSPLGREHVTYDIRESAARKKTVFPVNYGGVDHRRSVTLDTVDDLIQLKRLEQARPALAQLRCVEELRKISPAQQ